jgi:serine/threonine-protein kinase
MSCDVNTEPELETAHVLFLDAVGYSKLLIKDQHALCDALNRVVTGTDEFRKAEGAGKLLSLPTGDGMILVFSDGPEAPVRCATEVSKALRDFPRLHLRMGIHSGLVSRMIDVNERMNVAGAAINIAQRVMSYGDGGHILVSKRTADDLMEYPRWQPYLHEIGECTMKHGVKIVLVNFYNDEVGNPALPNRCKESSDTIGPKNILVGRQKIASIGLILSVIAAALAYYAVTKPAHFAERTHRLSPENVIVPEKSIAVLPFQNLSDDKQHTYFADGVQDEILTDLAKVADLKVISRTSVMQYKNTTARSIREVGENLGVAHILEGTVQQIGDRVHVTAQLIDARTDAHMWADRYDRNLVDVFEIENELAERIVSALQSRLSVTEKAAIEEKPTSDLAAYDLYVRAKLLIENAVFNEPKKTKLLEAIALLEQAVARDPMFALAYFQLAHAHDQMYSLEFDHSQNRLDLADDAIQTIKHLRPNSGEAHLALAKHLYWGYQDYAGARRELDAALQTLPNEPLAFLLTGYIDRRQGRWNEAMRNMRRAAELDPRNSFILQQIALGYSALRKYADSVATLDRAITIAPKDVAILVQRADVHADWRADTKPLHSTIAMLIVDQADETRRVAGDWLHLALWERDGEAAERAFLLLGADGCHGEAPFPRAWCEGRVALLRGDPASARGAFERAKSEVERIVLEQPNYAQALCAIGMIDAALGNKEQAIQEGEQAVKLLPVTKDSIEGSQLLEYLSAIYAWTGQSELALGELRALTEMPSYLSYGSLKLDPLWDPLRGDPRFDEIVTSLAPN